MRALFYVGLIVLVLGVLSLFVPIPHSEKEGVEAGGISIGITTHRKQTVSPIVSGVMILAGAGLMIAGRSSRA